MAFSQWSAIFISLKVAFLCMGLIAGPGIFLAWLLARREFRGKALLDALIHAPLVLPPVVTGYLLLVVFGKRGWIGAWLDDWLGLSLAFNLTGAVIAAAVMSFPLLVRSVRLAIELVDPHLEIAAATLGAAPLRIFLTITLPLASPGLITGLTLAFARSLGEFGATMTFAGNIEGETRTIPLAVFSFMQVPGKEQDVMILAILAIALSVGALLVSEWWARRMKLRLRGQL